MEVTLLVVNQKANARQVRLGAETVVGRSPECNLRIASGQVSRRHCLIKIKGPRVLVCDLGSANGTEVDGQKIPPDVDVPVAPGSTLVIGPLKFVFDFSPTSAEMQVLTGRPPSNSTTDLPSFLVQGAAPEEETKDYTPRRDEAEEDELESGSGAGLSSELDFTEGEPTSPAAMLGRGANIHEQPGPPSPDDTLHDRTLAEHARQAALRAREADVLSEPLFESPSAVVPADAASKTEVSSAEFEPVKLDAPASEEPPPDEGESAADKKKWNLLGFLKRSPRKESGVEGASETSPPAKPAPPKPSPSRDDDQALQDFFKTLDS